MSASFADRIAEVRGREASTYGDAFGLIQRLLEGMAKLDPRVQKDVLLHSYYLLGRLASAAKDMDP